MEEKLGRILSDINLTGKLVKDDIAQCYIVSENYI
jgi:hypothetical protein